MNDDELIEAMKAAFESVSDSGMWTWDAAMRAMLAVVRSHDSAELAAERERAEKAEANYRFMVERAADQRLDGYRELGQRAAYAENDRDSLRAELAALRIENHALKAEREKLLGCRDELREIAEAISDPRIHNTMTIAEWCREASGD